MIFIKRQFAIILMITMGFIALAGHFINNDSLREFTDKDATQWYMIIAGFAAFLGCLNLLQLHLLLSYLVFLFLSPLLINLLKFRVL